MLLDYSSLVQVCHTGYACNHIMLMSLYYQLGIMAYWVFGTETREGLDWQLEKMEGAKTVCVNKT